MLKVDLIGQREFLDRIANAGKELQAKIGHEVQAALEKEKSDKIEKIQREAFEQDKQAKIAQAIVSGALAGVATKAGFWTDGGWRYFSSHALPAAVSETFIDYK